MDSIRWSHGPREFAIYYWWQTPSSLPLSQTLNDRDYEWERVDACRVDLARGDIGQGNGPLRQMRHLLAGEGDRDVSRLTDKQVVDMVAGKLACRHLVLFERILKEKAKTKYRMSSSAAPASVFKATVTPSSFRPRQDDTPAQKPAQAVDHTDFQSVDQDTQAATLRLAARDGIPFCEVCQKRKRETERTASLQEAA